MKSIGIYMGASTLSIVHLLKDKDEKISITDTKELITFTHGDSSVILAAC